MADAPDTTKVDYRSTVFLPRTDFPMKAGLPQKEPVIAARWESEGLYQQIRRAAPGRAECRAYAQHWVDVQREQLKRLGISADWDKPYLTMAKGAEATIVSELFKFAESGQLYRGAKPVMWSPVEKTALAEAEIEYEDVVSTQIDVEFEIVESPIPELVGAYAVVWTTTPWTIPVNQGIAYGPETRYLLFDLGFSNADLPQEEK